jgi:L-lysine 2,3-aminomutase
MTRTESPTLRTFGQRNMDDIPGIGSLDADQRLAVDVVSRVLPFKTNSYVCEELIDWSRVPDDPMFQLTFPQRGMLDTADFDRIASLVIADAPRAEIDAAATEIRWKLNPHPSGQVQLNVPHLDGRPVAGMQHKYAETVLFFPKQGQTCHAYCTYCFRWPQFVKLDDLKFASDEADTLAAYLRRHPEVTDVIFTGGDPMIMRTDLLRRYVEPLLAPDLGHVNIRIGTKSPAYWPERFVGDREAEGTLRLFSQIVDAGRHLAVMAHWSHPVELSTDVAVEAVRRIRDTGAVVRCQAPLIRHVNDDGDVWADLVRREVALGCVPYYMFVERDTGAKRYFELPLGRALDIYNKAFRQVSGLGRTFRGPAMSATPGKVLVEDVTTVAGQTVFALRLLQSRVPEWSNRLFFAEYDETASWFDDLRPAFGKEDFFFAEELRSVAASLSTSEATVDLDGYDGVAVQLASSLVG